MIIKFCILAALWISSAGFSLWWYLHRTQPLRPTRFSIIVGAVTNFFDTLGIGSFATTTAALRMGRAIRDENLPGTLNVATCLPVIAQALIFISSVEVDALTLFVLITAAVLGGWFGASIVGRLPVRTIRYAIALALVVAAVLFSMINLHILPGGGTATSLRGTLLMIAIGANAFFGLLVTIGIGLYAPSLITLSLLGMSPLAAFPIMMGSGALLQAIAGAQFISLGRVDQRVALGVTLGGIPAVFVAAYLVKSLPLSLLRWVVIVVVLYTAVQLVRTNLRRDEVKSECPA